MESLMEMAVLGQVSVQELSHSMVECLHGDLDTEEAGQTVSSAKPSCKFEFE